VCPNQVLVKFSTIYIIICAKSEVGWVFVVFGFFFFTQTAVIGKGADTSGGKKKR